MGFPGFFPGVVFLRNKFLDDKLGLFHGFDHISEMMSSGNLHGES